MELTINSGLLKITGVLSYDPKQHFNKFIGSGYRTLQLVDFPKAFIESKTAKELDDAQEKTRSFYKNTYYAEFRDLMFTGRDPKDHDGLHKKQINKLQRDKTITGEFFIKRDNSTLSFTSLQQELFLFPDGIGIFSLSLDINNRSLTYISDLINSARLFESEIATGESKNIEFHTWISENILAGIPIVGNKLEVDEYSGSKFKVYSVIDLPPNENETIYHRDHLLYEIGTSSRLGTVANNGRNKPSDEYYNQIMQHKLSAFANYDGLALLDSFTVIGTGNYKAITDNSVDYIEHHQWNRAYFAIYVFNLYFRYNLFKFNTQFLSDPVKYRGQFQYFLNHYNFTHIAFNFLPNMIFTKMRSALGIDVEIEKFEKRLSGLASSIQEDQEKRQAFLLTLISIISSFSAAKDILTTLESAKEWLGWDAAIYYPLIIILALVVIGIVAAYLFPLQTQKLKKKWNRFLDKSAKLKQN